MTLRKPLVLVDNKPRELPPGDEIFLSLSPHNADANAHAPLRALIDAKAGLINTFVSVYVNDATGNDATGTGEETSPWKTLARALDYYEGFVLTKGALVVWMSSGTYVLDRNLIYGGIQLVGAGKTQTTLNIDFPLITCNVDFFWLTARGQPSTIFVYGPGYATFADDTRTENLSFDLNFGGTVLLRELDADGCSGSTFLRLRSNCVAEINCLASAKVANLTAGQEFIHARSGSSVVLNGASIAATNCANTKAALTTNATLTSLSGVDPNLILPGVGNIEVTRGARIQWAGAESGEVYSIDGQSGTVLLKTVGGESLVGAGDIPVATPTNPIMAWVI